MTVRGYQLGIDWSRQGTYAGTLEDVSAYADQAALTVSYGREMDRSAGALRSGSLSFALRNDGRQFSPENTSSPITGKMWPGVPVRLQKTLGDSIYTLFAGELDQLDIDQSSPANTFLGEALDAWGKPGAEVLSTELHRGIRTGDAVGIVLDEIGWTGGRDIDPGATYIPFWWEDGTDAATAIQKLVDSEGPSATAYVLGGTFVFQDRHHRLLSSRSQTSQATFSHTIPAGGEPGSCKILADSFAYDHGLKRLANTVVFDVEQRRPAGQQHIWSTEDTFALGPNESHSIVIKANDPFLDAQLPSRTSEYTLLSGTFTPSLSRTSGQSTILTLTADGSGAVISGMAVSASPVTVVSTVKVTEEDAGSVAARGRQTWPGEVPWANIYDARVIAQRIVTVYASNQPVVSFDIVNLDDTYLAQILDSRISDRIHIRNDKHGIDADFYVERLTHTIQRHGAQYGHRLRLDCQVVDPTQPENVFTFDVAGKGFNDGKFGLTGIDNPENVFLFDVAGHGFNDGKFAS